jgi:hypothetical protein
MANILIDGYNLIGIAHKDLEKTRQELIQKLHKYAKAKGHDITLVFDGWKNGQLKETITKLGGLTIIYSKLGEKADHVIKNLISSANQPLIVISSDREISDFTERKDSVSVTSDEFERKLYSFNLVTEQDKSEWVPDHEEYEDITQDPSRRKGNPRQLSQKDRKKIQALKRL